MLTRHPPLLHLRSHGALLQGRLLESSLFARNDISYRKPVKLPRILQLLLSSEISINLSPQSIVRESRKADRDGDKMATSMEKKIAELEMGLLHLQQNIDITNILLVGLLIVLLLRFLLLVLLFPYSCPFSCSCSCSQGEILGDTINIPHWLNPSFTKSPEVHCISNLTQEKNTPKLTHFTPCGSILTRCSLDIFPSVLVLLLLFRPPGCPAHRSHNQEVFRGRQ